MVARLPQLLACALFACAVVAHAEKRKPTPKPLTEEQVRQTLDRIVIPKVEFRETPLREAIDFFGQEAKRLDPKKRGVPFHMRIEPPPAPEAPGIPGTPARPSTVLESLPSGSDPERITVSLSNVSLIEALRYVTGLANLKFRIRPDGVHVVALHDPDPMFTQDIRIPTKFARDSPENLAALKKTPREFLIANGVLFEEPAAAILDDQAARLTVHNTRDQIELIETILRPPEIPAERIPQSDPDAEKRSAEEKLRQKMKTIILPEVRLSQVSLRSAVDTLKRLAQQHDRRSTKAERGVNLILRIPEDEAPETTVSAPGVPAAPASVAGPSLDALPADYTPPLIKTAPFITYEATKVTLQEAVAAIARQAGYHVSVQPYAVIIQKPAPPEKLITREWKIPPNAVQRMSTGPQSDAEKRNGIADRESAKKWLVGGGVTFVGGPSAIYIASSRRLIVRDTEEKLREIDEQIAAYWREHDAAEKAKKKKGR